MDIDPKKLKPGMVVVVRYNVPRVSNLSKCTAHKKLHYCYTCKQVYINWYKTEAMSSLSTLRERYRKGIPDTGKIRILHPSISPECPKYGEKDFCLEHHYYFERIL